jgi:hypothetical protein
VENSFASAPFILGIVTGGATTLDGTAYTTAATSPALGPGQKATYCSDGTNYFTADSTNGILNLVANKDGYLAPFVKNGTFGTGVSTGANVPSCSYDLVPFEQLVTNITYNYTIGVAASTGDWGIYDTSGNLLTHTGSQATTSVGGAIVKASASPAITIPPGKYVACACASSTTVSFEGILENGAINGSFAVSTGATPAGAAALGVTSCTAGVLPASGQTFTVSNSPNVLPAFYLTP